MIRLLPIDVHHARRTFVLRGRQLLRQRPLPLAQVLPPPLTRARDVALGEPALPPPVTVRVLVVALVLGFEVRGGSASCGREASGGARS